MAWIPFFIAWTAWFASLRILVVAFWQVCEVIRLQLVVGGDQFFDFWERVAVLKWFFSNARRFQRPSFKRDAGRVNKSEDGQVTVFGWLGLMIARGIGVAVSALPLTMDVKGRYGKAMAQRLDLWAHLAFSFFTTFIYGLFMFFWTFFGFAEDSPD
ncbi:hypothetical protein B0H66DRAFT_608358 [Apodospora peruviana]|uniref:Uncharacterized protein n=1 Tax=Apodospora peruviana TaxID=516989 RepID=A0AAE0HSI3_9PEZI|nr:hypothetical protein B0H66DRAFT_608358 [Apodospora peruviana]